MKCFFFGFILITGLCFSGQNAIADNENLSEQGKKQGQVQTVLPQTKIHSDRTKLEQENKKLTHEIKLLKSQIEELKGKIEKIQADLQIAESSSKEPIITWKRVLFFLFAVWGIFFIFVFIRKYFFS